MTKTMLVILGWILVLAAIVSLFSSVNLPVLIVGCLLLGFFCLLLAYYLPDTVDNAKKREEEVRWLEQGGFRKLDNTECIIRVTTEERKIPGWYLEVWACGIQDKKFFSHNDSKRDFALLKMNNFAVWYEKTDKSFVVYTSIPTEAQIAESILKELLDLEKTLSDDGYRKLEPQTYQLLSIAYAVGNQDGRRYSLTSLGRIYTFTVKDLDTVHRNLKWHRMFKHREFALVRDVKSKKYTVYTSLP